MSIRVPDGLAEPVFTGLSSSCGYPPFRLIVMPASAEWRLRVPAPTATVKMSACLLAKGEENWVQKVHCLADRRVPVAYCSYPS